MNWRAFSTDASMSKERRASTSVETLPGTIFKISWPNSTKSLSRVASTCSSRVLPYIVRFSLCHAANRDPTYVLLAIFDRRIHQLCIFGFLGSSEDERGVGGGILGRVLFDCCDDLVTNLFQQKEIPTVEIAGVADNGLYIAVSHEAADKG